MHYTIGFFTDSNRHRIEIHLMTDFELSSVQTGYGILFHDSPFVLSKLVYSEKYADKRLAAQRLKDLRYWTRAQKERLIRRYNPDWKGLGRNDTLGFYKTIAHGLNRGLCV